MGNKTILVTGANRGIGRAVAGRLAAEGCDLILACRDKASAEAACASLRSGGAKGRLEACQLDLSSLGSVRNFAMGVISQGRAIDILINNAAILPDRYGLSADGFELAMAVNYLGPFLLTKLLLPSIPPPTGKIINTCSSAFRVGRPVAYFVPRHESHYRPIQAYADSKLALLMSTIELSSRLGGNGPAAFAVDPGVTNTGMITLHRWFDPLTDLLFRPFIQTDLGGAWPSVAVALARDGEYSSGGYYRGRRRILVPRHALDRRRRLALWTATEEAIAHGHA